MKPKPEHLGEPYAGQWEDACMAAAYPNRPAYPGNVFDILEKLIDGTVLDIGCGTGDIARNLALRGVKLDAVDRSAAMIEVGRSLPGGDLPNWIVGRAEEAPLNPPYSLVTAGECIHWLDWERVFSRLRAVAPRIALVFRDAVELPWLAGLRTIIPRYSTNWGFAPYDLMEELDSRGLFAVDGVEETEVFEVEQTVESYIASIHSRNGFSYKRMGKESAAAFDAEVRELLGADPVRFRVRGRVMWG